jgi:cysteinyl-tRNA synthetase
MSLKLYNSLSRRKEIFKSLDPRNVKMYVCGPTVYDRAHLGNARPVVVFDVLYRYLKTVYPKVTYVRNITDVDDKINAASKSLGIPIQELTEKTTRAYHEDMNALGALPPDCEPKATEHIPQMIEMIQNLIASDHAYEADGHVLFQFNRCKTYGSLSRRNTDELLAGARVEIAPYKKNPGDFVLWKPSEEDLPGWDSPWGRGRPGWHIECSAMSYHYLGEIFDIHAGGIDLIFPHHENEIAQSCSAHGTNVMAHYWLHNGHLTVSGEKMSKSLGNFFTVHDLLNDHSGETIRLALLMTHYRQPLDWSPDVLQQAKQTLDRWYIAIKESKAENSTNIPSEILNALEDDLNTPLAISCIHQLVNQLNKTQNTPEKENLVNQIKSAANLMGLLQSSPQDWLQGGMLDMQPQEIEQLITARNLARKNKDFAESDRIRNLLLDKKIQLEDTAQGTTWRRM